MSNVKDNARKRKLDSTVQKNMQHGSDPMDVGAIRDDWRYGDWEDDAVAVGFNGYRGKGAGKNKSKGSCFNRGSNIHFARECPYPKGQVTK